MRRPDEPGAGALRAWGWVDHLRSGGTTPWPAWTEPGVPGGGSLPGARQLEVLRRLNEAGAPSRDLVGRVLSAATMGRGIGELPLAGAAGEGFGPRPVEPSELPAEDLLRVVLPLLADDLQAGEPKTGLVESVPSAPPGGRRRPGRRFRLVGDPGLAEPLRETLRAMGRPPGGPRPTVLVMGSSLDRMLAHVWAERCFDHGCPAWEQWLARGQSVDALPPRIDLPAVAARWATEVGARRVAVVLDPQALVPLLGLAHPLVGPAEVPAGSADLARRLSRVLQLRLTDDRRRAVVNDVLRPALAVETGEIPAVPAERWEWVERRAAAMRGALAAAGYAVHGGVDAVLPAARPGVGSEPADALALAAGIRLLLRFDQGNPRSREEDG